MPRPILTTERLNFTPYRPEHRPLFLQLVLDDEIMRHLDGPLTEQRANELFDKFCTGDGDQAWGLFTLVDSRFLGHAAFKKSGDRVFEPIVILDRPYWNYGYGKEVLGKMISFARQSEFIHTLMATIDPDHIYSRRLAESAGMKLDRWETDEFGDYPVYLLDCRS